MLSALNGLVEKKEIIVDAAYHWAPVKHGPVKSVIFLSHKHRKRIIGAVFFCCPPGVTLKTAVTLRAFRWVSHEEVPSCKWLKISVLSNSRTNLACKTKRSKRLPGHQVREAAGGAPADELLSVWSPPHCCTEGLPKVRALLASWTLQPPQKRQKGNNSGEIMLR